MGDRTRATWELWLIEPLDEDETTALKSELESLRKGTGYQETNRNGKVLHASCVEWKYPTIEQLGEQYETIGDLTKTGKILVELCVDGNDGYDACYGALYREQVFRSPQLKYEGPIFGIPLTDKPEKLRAACEKAQETVLAYRSFTAVMEKAIPWPQELQEALIGVAETA